jgi:MFS family permease
MGEAAPVESGRGRWMALLAALLGWMFDGLEMGLFPLAARPALIDLFGFPGQITKDQENVVGLWFAVATAGFLVGAATGGVLFGWLGDRLGRVRAMTLSVLTYAVFSGLCAFAGAAWQIAALRFVSALGMGGEWSLGVALVMEIWPNQSRALLAGLIGAAGNIGYLLIACLSLGLGLVLGEMHSWLSSLGMPAHWVDNLVAHSGWRLLMLFGAVPAFLTFFIRLFVPESKRWQHEQERGATSNWAVRDLLGVGIGAVGASFMIYLRAADFDLAIQLGGAAVALLVVLLGYTYPVVRYLQRSQGNTSIRSWLPIVRRMLLGACLGGVALLGTWASVQWAPVWADQLTSGRLPQAKAYTQIWSAFGAIFGTMIGALMCNWFGRRIAYTLLCLSSLGSSLLFFWGNDHYGMAFLLSVFLAGGCTASFYGWLPLYLPELFTTGMRATGLGFSFNFGRILAAVGVLQTSNLMSLFGNSYPKACSMMSLIYLVGVALIWLAPETRGRPLPE